MAGKELAGALYDSVPSTCEVIICNSHSDVRLYTVLCRLLAGVMHRSCGEAHGPSIRQL